jgi:hypothetical protein
VLTINVGKRPIFPSISGGKWANVPNARFTRGIAQRNMDELAQIRKEIGQLTAAMSVLFQHVAKIEAYVSLSVSLQSGLDSATHDKATEMSDAIATEMAKQAGINRRWKNLGD